MTRYNADPPHSRQGILNPNKSYDTQQFEEKKAARNETKIHLKMDCKLVEKPVPTLLTLISRYGNELKDGTIAT